MTQTTRRTLEMPSRATGSATPVIPTTRGVVPTGRGAVPTTRSGN